MKYSLFIGRWQPWHKGHQKLVETVLNEGKNVCIAVRDTPMDNENIYDANYRVHLITEALKRWEDKVKVIIIPDIEDVCFGRKVGWGIREIKLDSATEEISATKIRNANRTN